MAKPMMFIANMPSTATPRIRSSVKMRPESLPSGKRGVRTHQAREEDLVGAAQFGERHGPMPAADRGSAGSADDVQRDAGLDTGLFERAVIGGGDEIAALVLPEQRSGIIRSLEV